MSDISRAGPETMRFGRFYPVLLALFIGSGCAALIYEIVWFQLLELVIGSSAVSLAVLLATFMGGMCLGSLTFARVVPDTLHPLRVYAVMELGIGAIAMLVLYCLTGASQWYAGVGSQGLTGIVFRALLSVAFLLPPTVLMGATLPCVARWIENTPRGMSRLGILYTANLVGAVFGCLLAGFYLLRLYDMSVATSVAAALNATCAVLALVLATIARHHAPAAPPSAALFPTRMESLTVYVTIGLSGLTALGAQVVWTRLLSLLLGASIYTFSIILAVFLIGLGLGSSAGSLLARSGRDPAVALGWCQILLVAAIAWAGLSISAWLPYWPVNPLLTTDPWVTFQLDFARCLWAILPAACLWGTSFPLALAAAAPGHADTGRAVGAVYAANTVGAIVGSLAFGMLAIPAVGTQWAQRILMAIATVAAGLMLASRLRAAAYTLRTIPIVTRLGGAAVMLIAAAMLAAAVPMAPGQLFVFGRKILVPEFELNPLYVGEGMNASIAVSQRADGVRFFHVSGKTEASSDAIDMRLQRLLGHLATLLHAKPRSVLVVGFGAGVTAGTFVTYPEIERIAICEIEPLIPRAVAGYFKGENFDVLNDPRVTVTYDDARHFVLTAKDKFDIITTDPIHPWVKGAATLYTREYFELARRHLNPGGIITQWVPLYETTADAVKSEMATFFSVFPDGLAWINDREGGSDVVLLGRLDEAPIKIADIDRRLALPENARALTSLRDLEIRSAMDLMETFLGRAKDLGGWLRGAPINSDRDLRLQYLAGMGLNAQDADQINVELVQARRFPEGLFAGSADTLAVLREALEKSDPGTGQE